MPTAPFTVYVTSIVMNVRPVKGVSVVSAGLCLSILIKLDPNSLFARFWWIVVFLLSMLGCGVMIYKTYVKWNQTPIIVTFSEKTTPVWDIHFPSITICPETKVHAKKFNFTAEMDALLKDYHDNNVTSDRES